MPSDNEIRQLWEDPNYPSSFSGLENFKASLYLDKGWKIGRKRLMRIFQNIPNYSTIQLRREKFKRRNYTVHGSNQL